jgi:putative transposase
MKSYNSLFYHIVFSTKNRSPLIDKDNQKELYNYIWNKCKELDVYLHKIGGIENHIHMLASIPPRLCVADVVGQIKGVSSFNLNQQMKSRKFAWQNGYGVLTVSKKDVPLIKDYIINQEHHHSQNTILQDLEEYSFSSKQ